MNEITEQKALEEREKFVRAFNDTMLRIWRERVTLLDVYENPRRKSRSGEAHLLDSFVSLPVTADGRFFEVTLAQRFLEYGIWQDYGVGAETPRRNSGDLGKAKQRVAKPWFSRKYYASVMNLKEFYADNVGRQFQGVIADTLQRRYR